MSSLTPPTDDELDRLTGLATRPENRAYFFDRLDNPAWLEALATRHDLFLERVIREPVDVWTAKRVARRRMLPGIEDETRLARLAERLVMPSALHQLAVARGWLTHLGLIGHSQIAVMVPR